MGDDETTEHTRHWLRDSVLAFAAWWAAAALTTLLYPTVADYLPISLIWLANALAYGAILSRGAQLIPAFTLAALTWNIARGDAPADILIGTGTFLAVMLFVRGFARVLARKVEHDQARRLLRVPIIAMASATVFTSLGVWQFTDGIPDNALTAGLWLSEATSVLLFTPLAQQLLSPGPAIQRPLGEFRPVSGVIAAWTLTAFIVLAALLLTGRGDGIAQRWLPYLALTVPMLAVYMLPTAVTRFAVSGFVLVWVAVHYQVFDMGHGLVHVRSLLNGQMIIFTASLIAFLAIESVRSFETANRRLQAARLRDGLTDLLNDMGLASALRERLTGTPDPGHAPVIAVQVPDIDDLYTLVGHDAALGLERRIAEILRQTTGNPGLAATARLQPGLFALVPPASGRRAQTPAELAEGLRARLRSAEQEGQLPTGRLGLRVTLLDRVEHDDLAHLAPLLLMAARRAGGEDHEGFYRHSGRPMELIEGHRERLERARHLREALAGNDAEGRFLLYAQPIIDRRDREAHRLEILLRWAGADGAIQSPGTFMPVAEDFGLMPRIDRWVLERALEQVRAHPAHARLTEVAINLSGDSLAGGWLPDTVADLLERHAWPAERLCLEITETMLIHDTRAARRNLDALRAMGVHLAIDDFGTGRATFAYLQEYPVDQLKIDGRFIRRLTESGFDREVVRSTCALADHMGSRVVAEFVETDAQVELLGELGVDLLQGFGLAEPRPLQDGLAAIDPPVSTPDRRDPTD